MTTFVPKFFTQRAIVVYFILLFLSAVVFFNKVLPVHWILFGIAEVFIFFYFSNFLSRKWKELAPAIFRKKLLSTAVIIRLLYVVMIYIFYSIMTGQPFEFETADALGYHEEAIWLIDLVQNDQLDVYLDYVKGNYSDTGYVTYLSVLYTFLGKNILLIRLIKALLSAYTCVMVYTIAGRNFGEETGKIAGLLTLLSPNLIYYCGLHLKETELVFLVVWFIERGDLLIREQRIRFSVLVTVLAIGLALFFFRTVLGVTAFFSLVIAFLFYPSRNKSYFRKKLVFLSTLFAVGLFLQGGKLEREVLRYWEAKESNQQTSMKARAKFEAGNKLATYGTTAVFAPLILIAPFPTLVNIETQQNQMLLNGGYYTKNVFAFFLLIALVYLVKNKRVKQHLLPLTILLSYLGVLALSKFALSERFHLPALPFLIILAAFGITQVTKKHVKYYLPYLLIIAVIILGWNAFKLSGRGQL